MPSSFDYAIIRIVPRVDREEFLNAGIILFCPEQNFLAAKVHLNESRLSGFAPHIDVELIRSHLSAFSAIAAAEPSAGTVAQLNLRERFHWLVSPKSTILQTSPVHTGLCESPAQTLTRLFDQLCL